MNSSSDFLDGKLLLTIEEAARFLNLGRSHVYRHVLTGTLRSVKIGRSRRVPVYALRDFVEAMEVSSGEL